MEDTVHVENESEDEGESESDSGWKMRYCVGLVGCGREAVVAVHDA
jgi:hypothetical protein